MPQNSRQDLEPFEVIGLLFQSYFDALNLFSSRALFAGQLSEPTRRADQGARSKPRLQAVQTETHAPAQAETQPARTFTAVPVTQCAVQAVPDRAGPLRAVPVSPDAGAERAAV